MKSKPAIASAAALLIHFAPSLAFGQGGTWTNLAGGPWPTAGNWSGGVIADGINSVADFSTLNITAAATVSLNGARTIGFLKFGDATTASHDWTLAPGTPSQPLTMDVTSGQAGITVLTGRTATISAVLGGTDGINVTSATTGTVGGTLVLSGANTFSGGLTVTGGIVQLNNNAAGGVDPITVAPSANTGIANKLAINGGVTIANNIIINGGAPVAGSGAVQGVGTGMATVNGSITINAGTTNGGHFVGVNTLGSELVLNGAITSSVNIGHRAGRVVYAGGGAGYTGLTVTDTALVGATNGISTAAVVTLGGSASATLNLNGFDQSLAGLRLGNAGANSAITGTANLGPKTLTVTGDITTLNTGTGVAAHSITGDGTLNLGGGTTNFTVADSAAAVDLSISTTVAGSGGFNKNGNGTLLLTGPVTNTGDVTVLTGLLNVSSPEVLSNSIGVSVGATLSGEFSMDGELACVGGIVSPGSAGPASGGTISSGALTLDVAVLNMNVGTINDLFVSPLITNAGSTINIIPTGGALPDGTYPLLNYSGGTSPGLANFALGPMGHAGATLVDTGTAIALKILGNDSVVWDGTNTTDWVAGLSGNWKLLSNSSAADYVENDVVIFNDSPFTSAVVIPAVVAPASVTFNNTVATSYTVTGAGGITGPAVVTKNGNGLATLATANSYSGATTVNAGILELDHDAPGNAVLTGSSGVAVASGATLRLSRDDAAFTYSRSTTGTGTIEVTPRSVGPGTTALSVLFSGNNSGFTGVLRLLAPASGTYRLQTPTPAQLGSGSVEVPSGTQLYVSGANTYTNNITISGVGFTDASANIGALRVDSGANWAGNVIVDAAGARIGSHNSTGTISGNISGGNVEFHVSNYNSSYTTILTGNNTYGTTTIGGGNSQTAGVPSMRVNIGANGTTGTLGAGNVTIIGDGANGILGFDRSDGYTLLPGQTITGAGSNLFRTYIDFNTQGAGFSDNGSAINLGSPANGVGGNLRFGQGRVDTVTNVSGTMSGGLFSIAPQNNAVVNFKPTAVVSAGYIAVGQATNMAGTVNQENGATVNVTEQLRVGHFGSETSTYNMNGGTLTVGIGSGSGASPFNTPSTTDGGGAGLTGDNNINATTPATIVGGGIYLGIDGVGIFNHNAGAVSTNWIVLDNRGNSGPGNNMTDGIDQYNLNAGTLGIKSTWGIIQRNTSAAFNCAGGTIQVDNSGSGTGTGANITIPLDANITVTGAGTLDTNGAGNAFTLNRNVLGAGSLNLTGGGTINLTTGGVQTITPSISGTASLTKLGAGASILSGSGAGYTGPVTVSGGLLSVPGTMAPSSIAVADGAVLVGEPTTASLTLGVTTGATLLFDPNTAGALTATNLVLNGTVTIDFSALPPLAGGTYTVLNYTSKSGAGTAVFANAANYRGVTVNDTGSAITVTLGAGKPLVWSGSAGGAWDANNTINWTDASPAPDKFFLGDAVTFDDTGVSTAVAIASGMNPLSTVINAGVNNYVFTSTGTGIGGSGGILKQGSATLNLSGTNTYNGKTEISGGTVSVGSAASLGSGIAGNSILLSGGATLDLTAAADLGLNRGIGVGTGGGVLSVSAAAAQTVTIPGSLSGSEPLAFRSTLAGGGTFALSGANAGFSGPISISAVSTGLTTLQIASQSAVPNASSITVSHPAAATVNGNANTLNLQGVTLPAVTELFMSSFLNGAISQRSSVTSSGNCVINGPIKLTGNSIMQVIPANGTITLNGDIVEAAPGSFNGVFFLRGAGTSIVNGKVTLPTAGATLAQTDAGTLQLNSTGNTFSAVNALVGTFRLGATDAVPPTATLTLGQNDAQSPVFNLNGFNQTLAGLNWVAGTGGTKTITNSAAAPSTLTLNQATNTTMGGLVSGNLSFVKGGAGIMTLSNAGNSFTGNLVIDGGTITASVSGSNTAGPLGAANFAGRSVTVNPAGSLTLAAKDVFGNGIGNANLPSLILNNTTVNSARYNVVGNVTLNEATLAQSSSDSGNYEGYHFRGSVTVTGSAPSAISSGNGKANHLNSGTVFTVADATGSPASDLIVSTPLRDQAQIDFSGASGSLVKAGPGTLELTQASTYSGGTTVSAGTLLVNNATGSATGSGGVTVNAGATLGGGGILTGSLIVNAGGSLAPGNSAGTLTTGATTLNGAAIVQWEVSDWTGAAGAGYDSLNAASLEIAATSGAPIVIRVRENALANFTNASKTFTLATSASPITGFAADKFTVDASGFTSGAGTWSVTQSGNALQLNYSVGSAYDTWAASYNLTGGDAAKSADPDGDGEINLLEFALDGNPKSGINSGKVVVKVANVSGSDVLTLTLPVRTGITFAGATALAGEGSGIRYRIQGTDDLSAWTLDIDEVVPAITAGLPVLSSGWEYRTFRTPDAVSADNRDSMRVKVEEIP